MSLDVDPLNPVGAVLVGRTDRLFWRHVNLDGPIPARARFLGRCWVWTGRLNPGGYGLFRALGKTRLSHRVALALSGRILPPDLVVDHLCRTPACVRPDHLDLVTSALNTEREFVHLWMDVVDKGSLTVKLTRTLTSRECDRLERLAARARSRDPRLNGPAWSALYVLVAELSADGVDGPTLGLALGVSKQRVGQMVRAGQATP